MFLDIKRYIVVENVRVYTRILGEGPPIVLLHPSPHSSEMMMPLAKQLAAQYTVICIDTPGYGRSDMPKVLPDDLTTYTQYLHAICCTLNIEKPILYGSATGAQIAIRYALQYPDRVSHVFLDNAAHFEDGFREKILQYYFPDLSPKPNGAHLEVLWAMVSQMFQYFPWCFKEDKYALNRSMIPLEVIQGVALDFLKAGKYYDLAYRAAFKHEHAKHVLQLQPKTTIFRWKGSVILPYIDALLSFDLPKHIESIHIPEEANARIKKMGLCIGEKAREMPPFFLAKDMGIAVDEPENILNLHQGFGESRPKLAHDGSHLQKVWQMLQMHYPDMTLTEIQKALIYWFSKTL